MPSLRLSSSEKEGAETEGSRLVLPILNNLSPDAIFILRPSMILSALRVAAYHQEFWTETLSFLPRRRLDNAYRGSVKRLSLKTIG
jgi:hypothetical protein